MREEGKKTYETPEILEVDFSAYCAGAGESPLSSKEGFIDPNPEKSDLQ